jgi:dihydrofolate reductase
MGHPVIMGRKTFQSIGKPLPGRSIVVLTRDPDIAIPDVLVVRSPEEALERASIEAGRLGVKAVFIAGGGEIYRLFIDQADRLEITDVALEPTGDATFPAIDPSRWKLAKEVSFTKSGDDEADFSFRTYLRR